VGSFQTKIVWIHFKRSGCDSKRPPFFDFFWLCFLSFHVLAEPATFAFLFDFLTGLFDFWTVERSVWTDLTWLTMEWNEIKWTELNWTNYLDCWTISSCLMCKLTNIFNYSWKIFRICLWFFSFLVFQVNF